MCLPKQRTTDKQILIMNLDKQVEEYKRDPAGLMVGGGGFP